MPRCPVYAAGFAVYIALNTVRNQQVLPIHSRVVLRSFNGCISSPADCRSDEDYWKLIGSTGTVVDTSTAASRLGRVLVQFDAEVAALRLACHNVVPNSLYILESDLEKLQ